MNIRSLKLIGIIAVLIIFILIPVFMKSPYYLDLIIIMLMNGVLAMTFIMLLRTGLINMAIAAFWGVGAYASALLAMKLGLSVWLCLPAAAIITAIIALILGYPLLKNAGFTFIILTSVIGMLFVVAAGNISFVGGYNGISNIPPPGAIHLPFLSAIVFGVNSKIPYFYLALFLTVISILIMQAFYSAWTGRAWMAIGLNSRLAQSIGVNVYRYKLVAFVASSFIAGLMGSFYAHYQTFIQPGTFNLFPYTIYIQIYAILGGISFAIVGPLLGSLIMTFLPELMQSSRQYSTILEGLLIIIIIMFLPHGLLGLLDSTGIKPFFNRIIKTLGSVVPSKSKAGQV